MGVYLIGAAGVIIFYVAVLGVGIWAAAVKRKKNEERGQNHLILANRRLGPVLGVFTLVATWVGGAYVNGTAEAVYSQGLYWCQAPIGFSLSLLFGAILFVRPMRKAEYVTMLDPFQERYGARIGGLLFLPALFGDLCWCGAVLKALGSSLVVIAGIDPYLSVCASALLAALYTVFGGLYSVACTDVLQLIFIVIGLGIAAPFSMYHPAVSFEKNLASKEWLGEIKNEDLGMWVDFMLVLVFGGIPWQGYFQRILSFRSTAMATTVSIVSMLVCVLLAIPSVLLGMVARFTDWSLVEGMNKTFVLDDESVALPMVLRYLTPPWISFVGLGAVSAVVMSSADSCILASSSMFSRNVYRLTLRPKASERELNWILRISVIMVSTISTAIALTVDSVLYLSYLSSDLVYVVLFPQLLAVVHWPSMVDTYGCLAGYFVALILRIAGGEKGLGLPALIEYPFYDRVTQTQKFPFRTTTMLIALFTQLIVSFVTRNLLGKGYFPRCCDVLSVYSPRKTKDQSGVVQSSSGAALMDSSSMNKSMSGIDACDGISSCNCDNDRMTPHNATEDQHADRGESNATMGDLVNNDAARNNSAAGAAIPKACQTLQNSQNVRSCNQTISLSNRHPQIANQYVPISINESTCRGQILGVRNLRDSLGQPVLPTEGGVIAAAPGGNDSNVTGISANSALASATSPPLTLAPSYNKMCNDIAAAAAAATATTNERMSRDNERTIGSESRNPVEFNLNAQESMLTNVCGKKNVKGVKLVGMEGGTLRRPSLQGTFSPTPSVELVHILDRRQSSGSYGPGSLSPVPMGVEACKTHGTAAEGQAGNEHCRIKRGIVRHHR